jgi:uncharacterized membrane protein YcaP (DUF421 family)
MNKNLVFPHNKRGKRGFFMFGIDGEFLWGAAKIFWLIFILCLCALGIIRLMGNRTVGQLAPLDFVIMVGLGDIIVTTAMDAQQNFWGGIAGLLALLVLQRLLAHFSLKSTFCRRLFEGTPVTLIENGKIISENFAKTRFNFDDLRQELHKLGMDMENISKIKKARLESCGVFTVIKDEEIEAVTKKDVKDFFAAVANDPLHPLGRQWQRADRLMAELEKNLSEK